MNPETERTTTLFLSRLQDRYEIREAYLFGSRARDRSSPKSDADIAVLLRGHSGRRADTAVDIWQA